MSDISAKTISSWIFQQSNLYIHYFQNASFHAEIKAYEFTALASSWNIFNSSVGDFVRRIFAV